MDRGRGHRSHKLEIGTRFKEDCDRRRLKKWNFQPNRARWKLGLASKRIATLDIESEIHFSIVVGNWDSLQRGLRRKRRIPS